MIDKAVLLKAVVEKLEEEVRRHVAANEQASSGATHSEARAETKWDTCGLELSYLARGHAQQVEALVQAIELLRAFVPPDFSGQPIGIGALVEVQMNGAELLFFLLGCGGGHEVEVEGRECTVVTPESPVGAALINVREGDTFSFRAGSEGLVLRVV